MKCKKVWIKTCVIIALFSMPIGSYAKSGKGGKGGGGVFDVGAIIKSLSSMYGVNLQQLEEAQQQFSMLQKQYDIYEKQLKNQEESKQALTGKYGFGKLDKSSTKAWLGDTQNIKNLLDSYTSGNGQFGKLAQQHEKQFPIVSLATQSNNFNTVDTDYYSLSAKTALSTRTASEMEFNNIESKLSSQEQLIQKIDTTDNVKAAIDLLARMQAEGNKIMLENLRMLSVLTQQTAVDSQGQINAIAKSAKFLSTQS